MVGIPVGLARGNLEWFVHVEHVGRCVKHDSVWVGCSESRQWSQWTLQSSKLDLWRFYESPDVILRETPRKMLKRLHRFGGFHKEQNENEIFIEFDNR